MSRLLRSDNCKSSGGIALEDLSAKYEELLKLRQRVKIAECGRAIGPARLTSLTHDQLHSPRMN